MERYRSGHNGADSKSAVPGDRYRGFESHPLRHNGEMPELAEGARLEIVCTGRLVPRVRIPLSPPSDHDAGVFPQGE